MEQSVEILMHGTRFKHLLSSRMETLMEEYGLRKIDVEILYYLSRCGNRDTSRDIRGKISVYQRTYFTVSRGVCRKWGLSKGFRISAIGDVFILG